MINIKKWLIANKLSFNLTKTEYLVIGSPFTLNNLTSEPNIMMIDNVPIKRVTKTKSLGIQIDQFLSWDKHLEEICKKRPRELVQSQDEKVMFLVSHLYQSIMLWFNLILNIAVLCGTQLVPRFQIEFKLYKIEQQESY